MRRSQSQRGLKGRRWDGKPSILDNQHVNRRKKKPIWMSNPLPEKKRQNVEYVPGLGSEAYSGEWRARLLDGGFFLAAGLSNVVKNGVDHLVSWVRGGREVVENVQIPQIKLDFLAGEESNQHDRVEPELEPRYDTDENAEWLLEIAASHENSQESPVDMVQEPDAKPVTVSDLLRNNFEWSKMDSQDQEEVGLEDEILEDQAGALRSMFSNRQSDS